MKKFLASNATTKLGMSQGLLAFAVECVLLVDNVETPPIVWDGPTARSLLDLGLGIVKSDVERSGNDAAVCIREPLICRGIVAALAMVDPDAVMRHVDAVARLQKKVCASGLGYMFELLVVRPWVDAIHGMAASDCPLLKGSKLAEKYPGEMKVRGYKKGARGQHGHLSCSRTSMVKWLRIDR